MNAYDSGFFDTKAIAKDGGISAAVVAYEEYCKKMGRCTWQSRDQQDYRKGQRAALRELAAIDSNDFFTA